MKRFAVEPGRASFAADGRSNSGGIDVSVCWERLPAANGTGWAALRL